MNELTQTLLEGIRAWVEIESPTSDRAAVNRMMDRAIADWRSTGAQITRYPGRDGRGDHFLAEAPWNGDGPGVLFLCHLDTVHPVGTLDGPLAFRIEGDRAFGPGTYDMKGGAYLPLAAVRELVQEGRTPPLPVRVLYTSDEEVGSGTSRALIEEHAANARYVLVTEPARDGGQVVTARKGVGRYVMRAFGRAAHSGSRHADGRSAILEIARQVQRLEAMTDYARGVTFNIGQIRGGTADNVVPQSCEATIDMRILTMADAAHFDRLLRSLEPFDPDVRIEVTGGLNRPPYEKNAGVATLLTHARQLAAELGFTLGDTRTGGASDGNFTADLVATLDGVGVDGEGAHTLEEHLLISSLVPRMRLQKRLMETLR